MKLIKIVLGSLIFFATSFVIQGILGFVLAGDYFLTILIMRKNPLIFFSMLATPLTGVAFTLLYPKINLKGVPA
jgi:hypothetical protein